jgi:REP element-mobilizing transposase RayT
MGQIVFDTWREVVPRVGHRLWVLCVMPDHVRALIELGNPDVSLGNCVGKAKSLAFTRTKPLVYLDWQEKFDDHVLRPDEDVRVRARYIVNNPVRSGLTGAWQQWPWTFLDPEVPW